MWRTNLLVIVSFYILVSLVMATVGGLYAQDFAYYLADQTSKDNLRLFLTIPTILSWVLYIFPIVLTCLLSIKKKISKKISAIYIFITLLIAIPISLFSFFVFAMWMG
ncbi:hypothetical protein [Peribacillus huizhouensis]|uniref:Nitric oxide reductase large subunit n=1 Tax=Peribacillus huizhouensis TaxID=1501239 RepID=A0ABR6CP24_9BACI|nr:hypothetical protein [Peribacillus huizhouensis]MBA9026694.1 nitric oxide reductase large subunit [Peribacillus huizhouensis]